MGDVSSASASCSFIMAQALKSSLGALHCLAVAAGVAVGCAPHRQSPSAAVIVYPPADGSVHPVRSASAQTLLLISKEAPFVVEWLHPN